MGNYLGEFLGEMSYSLFFGLTALGLLRHTRAPHWLAWWGVATSLLVLVGMWRNATALVAPVAAVNYYLLPAWMIGFGIWLFVEGRRLGRASG